MIPGLPWPEWQPPACSVMPWRTMMITIIITATMEEGITTGDTTAAAIMEEAHTPGLTAGHTATAERLRQESRNTPARIPATQMPRAKTRFSLNNRMPNKNETATEVRRTGEIKEIRASGFEMAVK